MGLEAKTACVFLCQLVNADIRMKPRYTDAFWGEHPFDGDMILNKNKNKNKNKEHLPTHKPTRTVEENDASLVYTWRNPAGECGSYKWYERSPSW